MGDQQHAHAPAGLNIPQQIENLRLNGDIERSRRFVGNQKGGFASQCNGDHHPLLHTT